MIRRVWRNRNRGNHKLRRVVNRANVANRTEPPLHTHNITLGFALDAVAMRKDSRRLAGHLITAQTSNPVTPNTSRTGQSRTIGALVDLRQNSAVT